MSDSDISLKELKEEVIELQKQHRSLQAKLNRIRGGLINELLIRLKEDPDKVQKAQESIGITPGYGGIILAEDHILKQLLKMTEDIPNE